MKRLCCARGFFYSKVYYAVLQARKKTLQTDILSRNDLPSNHLEAKKFAILFLLRLDCMLAKASYNKIKIKPKCIISYLIIFVREFHFTFHSFHKQRWPITALFSSFHDNTFLSQKSTLSLVRLPHYTHTHTHTHTPQANYHYPRRRLSHMRRVRIYIHGKHQARFFPGASSFPQQLIHARRHLSLACAALSLPSVWPWDPISRHTHTHRQLIQLSPPPRVRASGGRKSVRLHRGWLDV